MESHLITHNEGCLYYTVTRLIEVGVKQLIGQFPGITITPASMLTCCMPGEQQAVSIKLPTHPNNVQSELKYGQMHHLVLYRN